MKKTLVAALTVATVAGSLVTAAPSAKAHDGVGAGIAAGLIGGAIASSRPPYGGPGYYEGAPPPPPGCYWQQQRYWDGYAWTYHPVRVCY